MRKSALFTLAAAVLLTAAMPSNAQAAQEQAQVPDHAPDRVLVKFKSNTDAEKVLGKHGLKEFRTLGKSEWKAVRVPTGQATGFVRNLQKDEAVAAVELDMVHKMLPETVQKAESVQIEAAPNDPQYWSQWHIMNIAADRAWNTVGSASRTIAVLSTGVDYQHADIAGKLVSGYDFVSNDSNADDDQGQGTAMAGAAAAITNNQLDVAGIDWHAKVMPVKVLDANGSGYTSTIIEGIQYAANYGASVLVMGIASTSYSPAFNDAINYAHNKGKVIVSGVGTLNRSSVLYPAGYGPVLGVTSSTPYNIKADGVDYGTYLELAAPGVDIVTLQNGGGYATYSSPAYAAAIVAGVASMTWSKYSTYSNLWIVNRLCTTADPINGTGTYWSCGKVNAYRAG